VLAEAQTLAAQTFGADRTWFLVNGSTAGVIGAIMATCGPGDLILLPRNVHQSAITGLILTGAIPIFLEPAYDPAWDLVGCVTPETVALGLERYPQARAVFLVSPTYQGLVADVAAIARVTHDRGIPLLVDEAHGAHLGFHPGLPPRALSQGADLAVQSTHKVLSALTQAAMVHIRGDGVCGHRLSRALQLVQSTSPSYLLLASLEGARHQMATQGRDLMDGALGLAHQARGVLGQVPGVRLWPQGSTVTLSATWDPTRLVVDFTGLGLTGFEADEALREGWQVTAELPALRHLTFLVTLGHIPQDMDRLGEAITALSQNRSSCPPLAWSAPLPIALPLEAPPLSPRSAFFAPRETVAWEQGIDRLSAETICPYPPGIPWVLPGERITPEVLAGLRQVRQLGGVLTGCADSNLETLQVVR